MGQMSRMGRSERYVEEFRGDFKKLCAIVQPGWKEEQLSYADSGETVHFFHTFVMDDGREVALRNDDVGTIFDPDDSVRSAVERTAELLDLPTEEVWERFVRADLTHGILEMADVFQS